MENEENWKKTIGSLTLPHEWLAWDTAGQNKYINV